MEKMHKLVMAHIFSYTYVLIFGLMYAQCVCAADYLGADGVLQAVSARIAGPALQLPKDEVTRLRDDLKTFSQSATNLAPDDAAKQWLALVDRAIKLQQQNGANFSGNVQPLDGRELLASLPPPTDWDALAKAVAARPPAKSGQEIEESGLRFLAATLTADTNGQMREITFMETKAADADVQTEFSDQNILQQWNQAIMAVADDPDVILKSLDYQLNSISKNGPQQLPVPNLVSEIGTNKAEVFLRKALVTPNVILQFQQPNDTSRLAQKLAMELLTQLKLPQWGLVDSLDSLDLYEAMDKQFGNDTNSTTAVPSVPGLVPGVVTSGYSGGYAAGMDKQQAETYYMLGLISQNRTQDAVVIAKKFGTAGFGYNFDEALKAMEQAGYTAALDNFLYQLLSQNPDVSFWDSYVEVAAAAGQTDRMLALVRSTLAGNDLSDAKKAALEQILYKALLAADNVDDGVQEIRKLINDSQQLPEQNNPGQLGVALAQIGVLEKRPDWTDEGITNAETWLKSAAGQNFIQNDPGSVLDPLVEILFNLQRGPEAEAMLTDALVNADRAASSQPQYGWNNNSYSQHILAELALLYHRAGRFNDVLNLLQQSPDWGTADLSGLFDSGFWNEGFSVMWLHNGTSPFPVPYLAANAMIAAGQKDQARPLVNDLLLREPALDRGYELLLGLDGTNAISQLDELFKHDQFEKRPLIWKAHLQRQEGQLEEAEKTIRQAISIDPSDGESGRGDRMRAYAELADILDARGDTNNAETYRQIVKAIRMSEDADQFYQAGLLKHAIGMYEEALDHFSDAYCIQSRLAVQLSELGQNQAAEEHYRRAYELMPDSFGRVESHCFGCEGVFAGATAQGIADQVFTKIVAERPDKPQAYYLLGYLRTEEERYPEARFNLLSAVRLDPDYLNAWKKLDEVSSQTLAPAKDRDEIVFNILRLDPLQRHAQVNFQSVSDLRGLWNAVTIAVNQRPSYSTNLLTLTASKVALDKKGSTDPNQQMQMQEMMVENGLASTTLTPGQAIAQTSAIQIAGEMITGQNSYFSNN